MCTTNARANNNGEEEFIEKLAKLDCTGNQQKILGMGIMHSYAPIQCQQWDKRKTHMRGVKYLAFINRGSPLHPGPRKHWRVHPARECPMVLVRVGALSCATRIYFI